MVITLGGGTTEVAVLALGDTVAVHSERFGGRDIDLAISSYLRKKYNLVIGEQTAEQVKHEVGAALPLKKELSMEVSGSNAVTGLPESIQVHTSDVIAAIKPALTTILGAVKTVLQQTPPELASDVMDKGIILTGGMSQLRKLDELLTRVTGVPCQVAEDPATCVIRGTQLVAENLEAFKKSVLWAAR
jgi:rod shape-determining protein MreB